MIAGRAPGVISMVAIGDRLRGTEDLGVAAGEGLGVTVGEHARSHAVGGRGERRLQLVAQVAAMALISASSVVALDDRRSPSYAR